MLQNFILIERIVYIDSSNSSEFQKCYFNLCRFKDSFEFIGAFLFITDSRIEKITPCEFKIWFSFPPLQISFLLDARSYLLFHATFVATSSLMVLSLLSENQWINFFNNIQTKTAAAITISACRWPSPWNFISHHHSRWRGCSYHKINSRSHRSF